MPQGRPTQEPHRITGIESDRRINGDTRITNWHPVTPLSQESFTSTAGPPVLKEASMTRSRSRAASQPTQACDPSPRAQKRRATEGGDSSLYGTIDAPEEERRSDALDHDNSEGAQNGGKQTAKGWSYAGRLALVKKVLEHKVYTGSTLSRDEAFETLRRAALDDPIIRGHFVGRTSMGIRSYFAKMKRDAERERSTSGRVSSVYSSIDPAYENWAAIMLKALDEIAFYEETRREKRKDSPFATAAVSVSVSNDAIPKEGSPQYCDFRLNDEEDSINNNSDNSNNSNDAAIDVEGEGDADGDLSTTRVCVGHSKSVGLFTQEKMEEYIAKFGAMPSDFTYFRDIQPIEPAKGEPSPPPPPDARDCGDDVRSGVRSTDCGEPIPEKALAAVEACAGNSIKSKERNVNGGGSSSGTVLAPNPLVRNSLSQSEGEALRMLFARAEKGSEEREAAEKARLEREVEDRKERELRADRRLDEEHGRWEQDRKDRIAREALDREEAQKERDARAAKDAADREERKHERELKAEVERARLAAEEKRQTQQHEMMMKVMEIMMKSSKD